MKERVFILIDGSNFYFKLKDLGFHDLLNFNFSKFNQFLANSNHIVSARYYIGSVRQDGTKKANKMVANQQKLFTVLKKSHYRYCLGYLLKTDGVYHEKGVDVQIATDILIAAYEKQCEKIILVSSDTDLSPAIKKAQEKGLIIEYIGFSHKPSVAMVSFCKESRLLTKEEMKEFVSDKHN